MEGHRHNPMGANVENTDLMLALSADPELGAKGFTASCGPTGGVVIDRWGHVRGVWHFHAGAYFWIPVGNSDAVYRTPTLDGAFTYTITTIATQ